jgi:hypothetical protein
MYSIMVGNFLLNIYLMPEKTIIISVVFVTVTSCGIFYKFDCSKMIGKVLIGNLFGFMILFFIVFALKNFEKISKNQESWIKLHN